MKKFFMIALTCFMAIGMGGCNGNANEQGTDEAQTALSSLAPDPEELFAEMNFEVTDPEDGDVYQFILKQGTREMFEAYVAACRDGIFTEANCDIENNYQAYTEDGLYWISVSFFPGTADDPSNTYVYVDVRRVQEEEA